MANTRKRMESRNPMLQARHFEQLSEAKTGRVMTAAGTANKSAVLVLLIFAGAILSWQQAQPSVGLIVVGVIVGFILALVTTFKPIVSPITAPLYAFVEGLVLGGISVTLEASYPGIAIKAVIATISVFFLMNILYKTNVIRVTDKFRSIMMTAIMAIMFMYLFSFILQFFGITLSLFSGGPLAIGFSIVVVLVASFSLLLDFDMIERMELLKAPKYMEWYCGFALTVTLVWLYLEILRLLSLFSGRD